MEKSTPHCRLVVVCLLLGQGRVRATKVAFAHAQAMGADTRDMIAVLEALTPADFHKSMTTHENHRVWQDVYRPMTKFGRLHVKLTVVADVLIVSFKEA